MHNAPSSLSEYTDQLDAALENHKMRKTLDKFATDYKVSRVKALAQIDAPDVIQKICDAKDEVARNLDKYYEEFKKNAEAKGVHVYRASTPNEANEIIAKIAKDHNVKSIMKSKSMVSEETMLNKRLEEDGISVLEGDLGAYIIQLRHEGPSHLVLPAIHLSCADVAGDFSNVTGKTEDEDVDNLVKVAREQLRQNFIDADMGMTGANFAVAETGSFCTCTNEGNARLVSTVPPVHVAITSLDKLVPKLDDALNAMKILARNATGQPITTYVTWYNGTGQCKAEKAKDQTKEMHIVFVDNNRSTVAKDPLFSQVFRCIRCGACANICPVYRLVGGLNLGYIYMGAIGLIMTYFFHGREKAKVALQNCVNCEACKVVCAGGIDLPRLIRELRVRINEEEGAPRDAALLSSVMKNRKMFHTLLKFAKYAQLPVTAGTQYQRHLPAMFFGKQEFKALPAIAKKSFRDQWEQVKPKVKNPRYKVALFAGCAGDFVYPEQLTAAMKVFEKHGVDCDFPMDQSCCGLPLEMMGQRNTSLDVSKQNTIAFDANKYDAIITLCASCASHLKHTYPEIIGDQSDADDATKTRCAAFVNKVTDFSSFVHNVLKVDDKSFKKSNEKVTYHASCHLCRSLKVTEEPRNLIAKVAEYVPSKEEDVCCGFGGSYSMKFPGISKNLLEMKLANAKETGASRMVMDCPGCVMQIRGGAVKQEQDLKVTHIAELLAEHLD